MGEIIQQYINDNTSTVNPSEFFLQTSDFIFHSY